MPDGSSQSPELEATSPAEVHQQLVEGVAKNLGQTPQSVISHPPEEQPLVVIKETFNDAAEYTSNALGDKANDWFGVKISKVSDGTAATEEPILLDMIRRKKEHKKSEDEEEAA